MHLSPARGLRPAERLPAFADDADDIDFERRC
jgi:hypothetical protein